MSYKILGLGILSFVLMFIDHLSDYLDDVRSGLVRAVYPIIIISNYPNTSATFLHAILSSRTDLGAEIKQMEGELLILQAKTVKMAALAVENKRLRNLLGYSNKRLQNLLGSSASIHNVLVAELVGINPNPSRHMVVIDRGSDDNVFVGQPVLDAGGLLGQVVEVEATFSRVLLIIDPSHSVPVQLVRNNLRFIARGSGITRQLYLKDVHNTADIKEGDELVSSGLGNIFPVGYPVAIVSGMKPDSSAPFSVVRAKPAANLDLSRHVLLVFSDQNEQKLRATLHEEGYDG